jgi:hypothetical protein
VTDNELQQAIDAIKAGNREKGQAILTSVLKREPQNEVAWQWLSVCQRSDDKKIYCLQQALIINPSNDRTKQTLEKLLAKNQQVTSISLSIETGDPNRNAISMNSPAAESNLRLISNSSNSGNNEIQSINQKICPNCGHKLKESEIICNFCGNYTQVLIQEPQKILGNVCPLCRNDDMVRRITAIVSAGTSTYVTSGQGLAFSGDDVALVGTTSRGRSQTTLSKQLAPPARPDYVTTVRLWGIMPLLLGPFLLILGLNMPDADQFACLGIPIMTTLLGIGWLFWFFISKQKNEELNNPIWNEAMQKWETLYYCGRDHIVYDPNTKRYTNAENMNDLLYS